MLYIVGTCDRKEETFFAVRESVCVSKIETKEEQLKVSRICCVCRKF